MVDKNDAPNESEPIELVEPTTTDEVILDDSDADGELEYLVEPETDESADEVVVEQISPVDQTPPVEPVETEDEAHPVAGTATGAGVGGEGEKSPSLEGSSAPVETVLTNDSGVAAAVQTVYITAPVPPKKKGNRGIGTLYAILAAIVFGVIYLGIAALLILFVKPDGVADAVGTFVTGPLFYLPTLIFLVLMVLWALLANRASWWAWVIGSLVIAALTYLASIGALILMAGGFGLTASEATQTFRELAVNPVLIAAGLLAREVAIWFGAAIASRGRKVRERNIASREEFEREEAEKRAELGGRTAH
ncbi:MAG: hypothetical protein ABIX09_00355 [Terrimesophilobacter sp.]